MTGKEVPFSLPALRRGLNRFTANPTKMGLPIHLNYSIVSPYTQNELIVDTSREYTKHKYIQISDYESYFQAFHTELSYPADKPAKILYLANLSLLLANLIFLTGDWDTESPEERALAIVNIELAFPGKFSAEREVSDVYVMHELRTQIFVQHFLEEGGSDDWETTIQLGEIFKLNDMKSINPGVPPFNFFICDGSFEIRIGMLLA